MNDKSYYRNPMAAPSSPKKSPIVPGRPPSQQVMSRKPKHAPSHEEIAARARAIWQAKGCCAGQDVQNWIEAETQLKNEMGLF